MNSNQTSLEPGFSSFPLKRAVAVISLFLIQTCLNASKAALDSLANMAGKDTAARDSTNAALNNAVGKESENLVLEVGISVVVIALIVVVTWMMSSGGRKDKNAKPTGTPPPHTPSPKHHVHAHGHRR
jgi:hypothetical protein